VRPFRRRRLRADTQPSGDEPGVTLPEVATLAAPGLELIFSQVPRSGAARVLDLGPAVSDNLALLAPWASCVQVVDLFRSSAGATPGEVLAGLSAAGAEAFDVALAWDALDYLSPAAVGPFIAALGALCRRGAWLHALVHTSESMPAAPCRYRITEGFRLRCEPAASDMVGAPNLSPAEVEKRLVGFRLEHGFLLSQGMREFVAIRVG
jgi:hypothetical protein